MLEEVEAVRRSSREDILDRICQYASNKSDYPLYAWACVQLGIDTEHKARNVSKGEQEQLFKKFGPLRTRRDLLTKYSGRFAELVQETYTDAVRYPEFGEGMIIIASSTLESQGSGSRTYHFEAGFNERFALERKTYETKWAYDYEHGHDEGPHDPDEYVSEQLKSLRCLLSRRLTEANINVDGNCLIISRKAKQQ